MRIKIKIILITGSILIVFALIVSYLLYNGYLQLNNPSPKQYPIRGIDVSGHQKEIDWTLVKGQDMDFVYIKSTEGMDFVDKYFKTNWEAAIASGFKVGAYHFFTFRSSGNDQADNYIRTVPKVDGALPPVIDIEFGGNSSVIPRKETIQRELNVFIDKVKTHYGKEPILYVLYNSYDKYIKGDYSENRIWIRDILKRPRLKDYREWTIWQYSNRGRVEGISTFVDLNVFHGTEEEFDRMTR